MGKAQSSYHNTHLVNCPFSYLLSSLKRQCQLGGNAERWAVRGQDVGWNRPLLRPREWQFVSLLYCCITSVHDLFWIKKKTQTNPTSTKQKEKACCRRSPLHVRIHLASIQSSAEAQTTYFRILFSAEKNVLLHRSGAACNYDPE